MKKLLLLLLIPFHSISQQVLFESNKYVEIHTNIEKTQEEIHQKISEWTAINFNSANDVIQLNSLNKMILKGRFTLGLNNNISSSNSSYLTEYWVDFMLNISIRDNKYKLEISPVGFGSPLVGELPLSNQPFMVGSYYEDLKLFENFYIDYYKKTLSGSPYFYSDKKIEKFINKNITNIIEGEFLRYKENKQYLHEKYSVLFNSINSYLSTEDDF